MAEPKLGRQLGAMGRAHVVDHYDWRTITPRLEAILMGLR
jgi:glycosyltransferase involved in cell wall biosynthesis